MKKYTTEQWQNKKKFWQYLKEILREEKEELGKGNQIPYVLTVEPLSAMTAMGK